MPHIPSLGYSHCEAVRFRPFVFYPDKPIQVQITVNHIDTSDMTYVHDATVSWIEDVSYEQFTGCVMAAGYNERTSSANVSIDWIAYRELQWVGSLERCACHSGGLERLARP